MIFQKKTHNDAGCRLFVVGVAMALLGTMEMAPAPETKFFCRILPVVGIGFFFGAVAYLRAEIF